MENKKEIEIHDKFQCPICQCILTNPYKITLCHHIFCKDCIESTIIHQGEKLKCPLCNTNFNKKNLKAESDLNSEIKSKSLDCYCKNKIKLSEWNDHILFCKDYNNMIEANIKQIVVQEVKPTVNRSTFNCPLCQIKNLDREGLIKHVKSKHKNDEAVCPICLCQPWGDPNYVTHLYGHLNKRHKFEYETTVDYNNDEDEILKKVLEESLKYK
jgi:hypothetical protein